MFHCAEDYLVTSDPRGGEREENIVNFPCRFECSTPLPPLSLRRTRRKTSFFILLPSLCLCLPSPSPSSLPLCRFRMPIKLTSCLVNDRHGHRGKSNSGLIRVARRTSFRCQKRKDLCLAWELVEIVRWASARSFHREKTRYNLTQEMGSALCFF